MSPPFDWTLTREAAHEESLPRYPTVSYEWATWKPRLDTKREREREIVPILVASKGLKRRRSLRVF